MTHEERLTDFVRQRAVPPGMEDLDRGDNHWVVHSGASATTLRFIARGVHDDPSAACDEALVLVGELAELGYRIEATSRVGAAVRTGPVQQPAGWSALLDVRVGHESG